MEMCIDEQDDFVRDIPIDMDSCSENSDRLDYFIDEVLKPKKDSKQVV